MPIITTTWGGITLALYVSSLAVYVSVLYANRRGLGPAGSTLLACGLVTHYLALMERSRLLHSVPYQDLAGSMSLFAWLLALTYLGLELVHRQRSIGPLLLPFVVLFFTASAFVAGNTSKAPARGPLFALHVTVTALAYAAFAIAFVLSAIYLVQNRVLRRRHPGSTFWRFPPLETLERVSRSAVLVGVVALVVGVSLGAVWAQRLQGHFWNADAKEIASLVILASYGAYLWLGRTTQWRGARAARLCVFSFVLVVFSYTVVNLYLSRYHRYF